jgi:hypothetical protein
MSTSATSTMTPERWQTVDHILQGAVTCPRAQRDAFVATACGDDTLLRAEVSSLLVVYDATPADFLERPAIEEHGLISETAPQAPSTNTTALPQAARMVTARLAVYAAAAGIVLGVMSGWHLAHSPTVERWRNAITAIRQQTSGSGTVSATVASSPAGAAELSLAIVDRSGRISRDIAADRPRAPRFSPDGQRVAYAALGPGRRTSDVWITDVEGGAPRRFTDDDGDSNNPQWSPDGTELAYAVNPRTGKAIAERPIAGGDAHIVAPLRPGDSFPTDWLHDASGLLVNANAGNNRFDILMQPADGSAMRPYATTSAQETAARMSPHTHWVAYTSDESGHEEVYVDSYPRPGFRVMVSQAGGVDPVWRGDGRELYYWRGDALIAVPIDGSRDGRPPILGAERVLFHSGYEHSVNSMYDVSPDGTRFAIVRRR